MPALSENQENAISGKQKGSVQEETHVVSATEIINVDSRHKRPLLLQDRRHKMTEEDLRKETPPGEVVHPERKVKDPSRITLQGIVRIRRVIIDIFPYVQIFFFFKKTESGCKFGDKCLFRHTETDRLSSSKSKKSGGKGSVALLKESTHWVVCTKILIRENRFFGKDENWDHIAPSNSPRARGTT